VVDGDKVKVRERQFVACGRGQRGEPVAGSLVVVVGSIGSKVRLADPVARLEEHSAGHYPRRRESIGEADGYL